VENCPDETFVLGKPPRKGRPKDGTTAQEIREMSDYQFYAMTQQMSGESAMGCLAVQRGVAPR
jgi:hypothetical protein